MIAGDTATFTVTAAGTAPLSFQWLRNGQELAGATSPSLVLSNAQGADNAAGFSVRVSNSAGTITSQAAVLSVLPRPTTLSLLAGDLALVEAPITYPIVSVARDGTGGEARFDTIVAMAVDASGTVYAAEPTRVRKITAQGVVTTLAGGEPGYVDGTGTDARFGLINGIAVDPTSGNVLVSDLPNTAIRKITPAGVVTTLVGGFPSKTGHADGPVATALVVYPDDVAVDKAGVVYFVDGPGYRNLPNIAQRIRKIQDGVVSTVPGGEFTDFVRPGRLAVDSRGNMYLTGTTEESSDCTPTTCRYTVKSVFIRKLTPAGVSSIVAGSTLKFTSLDAYSPSMTMDAAGNFYFLKPDSFTHLMWKIDRAGVGSTVLGTPLGTGTCIFAPFYQCYLPPPHVVLGPVPGGLKYPMALTAGPNGSLYVTSTPNGAPYGHVVLKADAP